MALNDLINAYTKSPSCKVFFNGRRARDILRIEFGGSINDSLSTARIELLSIGSIRPEDRVQIQQGYDGQDRLTFTGIVDTIQYNEYERSYVIEARDVLKKALDTFLVQEVAFGVDQSTGFYYYSTYTAFDGGSFHIHEYSNSADLYANHPETVGNITNQGAKAEAVVQWLLHMSGLDEGREIQVDDTNFFIGDISPARFHLESVYDAAQRIAQLIGWRIFADVGGVARFKRRPRAPGGYSSWSYSTKKDPRNIHTISRSDTNMDLRTYVEVRGASGIKYIARGTSPYLGDTPYRGVLISNELIDTLGIATYMGDRVLSDLNRLKTTVELAVDGNPNLTPASTVNVTSDVATGSFLVEDMQTTMSAEDGYKANLTCSSYPGSVDIEPTTSGGIVADFSAIQVVSFGDPKLMTTFDGSASYSQYGIITTWSWDWPDSTNYTSSSPIAQFAFDQASISNGNSVDVSLTVTDELGNTATTTSGITYESLTAGIQILYRQLYAALTTKAAGSLDGGAVWNTQELTAVSVAASNFAAGGIFVSSGYALFGTNGVGDTGVYRTTDCLSTVTKVLSTTSDPVSAVHVAELDGRYALAGTESGKVYTSRDSGVTWTAVTPLTVPIREIRHAYTNYEYILVVGSGVGKVYESYDLGQHWATVPGTSQIDANRESSGSATNYYGHASGVLGVVGGVGTAITFSGGGTVAVPALTVAIDNDQGVMIADINGQHWNADDGVFSPTQNNPTNTTKHMLRDGDVLNVVYYATTSGVYKSLDGNHTIQALYTPSGSLPSNGWGRQVAYGPLAPISSPARIYLRGTLANPNATGWFVASGLGWQHVVTAPIIGPADAGPGYIVYGTEDNFNLISAVASGTVVQAPYGAIPSVAGGHGTKVGAIMFSRRPTTISGVLPSVYVLATNAVTLSTAYGRGICDLFRFDSFFTDPTSYVYVIGVEPPSFFDGISQVRMSYGTDIIHNTIQEALFAPGNHLYSYDGLNMETQLLESYAISGDLFATATLPLEGWIPYFTGSTAKLRENDAGTINLPYLDDLGRLRVWTSSARPTTLYVGYDDGDSQPVGIYTIENLGRGRLTQIYDPPAPYTQFRSLTVTYNLTQTQDYICAVFKDPGSDTNIVVYSLDAGASWNRAPDAECTSSIEAYYVDSLEQ